MPSPRKEAEVFAAYMINLDNLRRLLIKYGDHSEGCPRRAPSYCFCECNCGWSETLDPMLPTADDVRGILG